MISNCHSFVDEVPVAEMMKLKKLKLTTCSVPTTDEPDLNKSAESYLLCNKVRVYTSMPDVVLPKGSVVLPIAEGKWTIVSLE